MFLGNTHKAQYIPTPQDIDFKIDLKKQTKYIR
jgi:hypothetical protein